MDKRAETGITSNQLKLLACIFMLCDHVGFVLMNNNWIMRAVGRLAFPIFVFLLVEGYRIFYPAFFVCLDFGSPF